jgi:hypothetical protein
MYVIEFSEKGNDYSFLNSVNRLAFVIETTYDLCEAETEFSNIILITARH